MAIKFITFCAIYRNEASRMRLDLDWASKMFDNMIIGVQQSDDATLEIAKEYTKNIILRPSESPEESKDFIMEKVKTHWTFWLDADEFPSVSLMRWLETLSFFDLTSYDSVSFLRVNYIDGLIIEGGQGIDKQFRMMIKHVRWNTKLQGKRIHIHPIVRNTLQSNLVIFHHRSLQKIKDQTERWNQLEPLTKEACDKYVKDVEKELEEKKK